MRRVLIYLFFDKDGIVDDFVPYKLRALREHGEHIHVVSNGPLTEAGRARLAEVADTVQERENVGFDVWGYKKAIEAIGPERLAEFDELLLLNYTFFGPVFPFGETFARMDKQPQLDFWGLTAHPDLPTDGLDAHLQTSWIAVRRRMFTSPEFQRYWGEMPMIRTYLDSIRNHEGRFTKHFIDAGFRCGVAFPAEDYPVANASIEAATLLLDDRCPIVKRRLFFHDPVYLEEHAILPSEAFARTVAAGYPAELIWQSLLRTTEPRVLYTNLALFSVLPDSPTAGAPEPAAAPRICVLAHMYYADMVDELMSYIGNIPVDYDLVVTTDTAGKRTGIEAALARFGVARSEVRVVASNDGRSESAFLVTCRDVLTGGDYDLVLKVHSKRSPQDEFGIADTFKRHTIENLLSSPGYVAEILRLFAEDPSLGMVFPPLIHIGLPTMGHSWFANYQPAKELAATLGIRTPFDPTTPISANGGMFWARPEALAKLAEHPFTFADFGSGADAYRDGQLTHVLERLYSYTVADAGFSMRAVTNARWAAVDYTLLEFKMQKLAAMLPGYLREQMSYIARLQQQAPEQPLLGVVKQRVNQRYPQLARRLAPGYRGARQVVRSVRTRRRG